MKPNPYLVNQAIEALHAEREMSALVGDQVSDIIAAHAANIMAIGFANKERKLDGFKIANAELIVTSMAQLILGGKSPELGNVSNGRHPQSGDVTTGDT